MTTAAVAFPPEMRVVASIRALRASRRYSSEELCRHLGISRSTWFNKMNSGQFTIAEIISLAELFRVPVQSMVDGQVTVATLRAKLMTYTGEPTQPPRRGHLRIVLPSQ